MLTQRVDPIHALLAEQDGLDMLESSFIVRGGTWICAEIPFHDKRIRQADAGRRAYYGGYADICEEARPLFLSLFQQYGALQAAQSLQIVCADCNVYDACRLRHSAD